jgi:hypothetical protein
MLRHLAWTCAGVALVVLAFGSTAARAQWAGDIPGKRPSTEAAPAQIGNLYFRVESTPTIGRDGRPRLTGYVYNDYEEPAANVEIRIEPVDLLGHDEGDVVKPLDQTVPAKGRAYFDVPVPEGASYRVAVVSFEFVELEHS